jgi:hypothetical protein
MKTMILAAVAALSLGLGVANAATSSHSRIQQGDNFNFLEGGGG